MGINGTLDTGSCASKLDGLVGNLPNITQPLCKINQVFKNLQTLCYDLASSNTASLSLLVYQRRDKDKVVVVALSPRDVNLLAASEDTPPCHHSQPSRLDTQSVVNNT